MADQEQVKKNQDTVLAVAKTVPKKDRKKKASGESAARAKSRSTRVKRCAEAQCATSPASDPDLLQVLVGEGSELQALPGPEGTPEKSSSSKPCGEPQTVNSSPEQARVALARAAAEKQREQARLMASRLQHAMDAANYCSGRWPKIRASVTQEVARVQGLLGKIQAELKGSFFGLAALKLPDWQEVRLVAKELEQLLLELRRSV